MIDTGRERYLSRRRRYQPESVRLVIVAESPPSSGRYFYDPDGAVTEPLFAAFMKQLGFTVASKGEGLEEFQRRGWVLIDATYEPVNAYTGRERDRVIIRDYPLLRQDLEQVMSGGRPL